MFLGKLTEFETVAAGFCLFFGLVLLTGPTPSDFLPNRFEIWRKICECVYPAP